MKRDHDVWCRSNDTKRHDHEAGVWRAGGVGRVVRAGCVAGGVGRAGGVWRAGGRAG